MILVGDNRETLSTLEDGAYQALFTSPPYFGLRLYGDAGEEIGKERALDAYVASIVDVMRLCRAKLRDDGVAWVNLGDSYSGSGRGPGGGSAGCGGTKDGRGALTPDDRRAGDIPDGNALLVPFRVATALQQDGWTLRAMLPWVKIASMPESVQSRPSIAHEYVLFLTKRPSGYFYDADAVRVGALQPEGTALRTGQHKVTIAQGRQGRTSARGTNQGPAGRSYRSSDVWRASARSAAEQLLAAADGQAIGLLTNDDAPAALVVNPKGSGIPHFAMWPTRLVAPMVLASTPEAGCCAACGAPWKRVVELGEMVASGPNKLAHKPRSGTGSDHLRRQDAPPDGYGDLPRRVRHQRGFAPSCAHTSAPTRPARILDPFAGAGTTLAVAECLGREAVGCELYQKNADLYPDRKAIVAGEVAEYLRERGEGDKAAEADADPRQLDMFGGRP